MKVDHQARRAFIVSGAAVLVALCAIAAVRLTATVRQTAAAGRCTLLVKAQPIEASGNFCLASDIHGSLLIRVDNVTLDLKGHSIICSGDQPGILADNRRGLKIKNGTIRGCRVGIQAEHATKMALDRLKITDLRYIAVDLARGDKNIISDVTINGVTGTDDYAIGFNGLGSNSIAERVVIRNTDYKSPGKEGVGIIIVSGETGATLRQSLIEDEHSKNNIGIWIAQHSQVTLDRTSIVGFDRSIASMGVVDVRN